MFRWRPTSDARASREPPLRANTRCKCWPESDSTHRADALAANISLGDHKRLELARALATDPELLLCDEICGGLTPTETRTMLDLLRQIRQQGTTIMYVEHDVKAIMAVCDRVMVLNYGQKLAEGNPQEIQNDPSVIEAYLGKAGSRKKGRNVA